MVAKLTQFYGLDPERIDELDSSLVETLWQAVTVIEAREALSQMNIADFPYKKKEQRRKIHQDLHRQAYPSSLRGDAGKISLEEAYKALNQSS